MGPKIIVAAGWLFNFIEEKPLREARVRVLLLYFSGFGAVLLSLVR